MINKIIYIFKATILKIMIALLFIFMVLAIYKLKFERVIESAPSLDNVFAATKTEEIEPIFQNIDFSNKPQYGSKYATLKIPAIELELPVYFGESSGILKLGIGHDSTSYLPGEGGSIVYMGHNFKSFLARLPEVKNGEIIEVETEYGTFDYNVYDSKIVNETDIDAAPIQKEEEVLMIYTCWPINNVVHASQRYIVYAK